MKIIVKKYLKISGILLASLFILLIILSVIVNFLFKEQLIKYVIEQVNKKTDTQINIQKADITFWKSFPNVGIEFSNITVQSSGIYRNIELNGVKKDTLLAAREVVFEFNLFSILSKQYVLKQIIVADGTINLVTGRVFNNYDIQKKTKTESENSGNDLDIRQLEIKKCKVNYTHVDSKLKISTYAKLVNIKALFSKGKSDFTFISNLNILYLSVDKDVYVQNRLFTSDLKMSIDEKSNIVFRPSTTFSVSSIPFRFSGEVLKYPADNINLYVKGDEIGLNSLMDAVPGDFQNYIKNYRASGKLDFGFILTKNLKTRNTASININFNVKDGSIIETKTKIKLNAIQLSGTYSNGLYGSLQSSFIKVDKYLSKLGDGEISLNGEVRNFVKPTVKLSSVINLKLKDIKEFFNIDTLQILDGAVNGSFTISGTLPSFSNFKISDAKNLNYSGQFSLNDASFQLKNNQNLFSGINGLLVFDNDIKFNNLTFNHNDNAIKITGTMYDGIPYFLKLIPNTKIDAELTSVKIDLSKYFVKNDTVANTAYSRDFLFPENISFDLKLNINSFILNKFEAKWIKGNLSYKPGLFILRSLNFESCDGKVSGNGAVIQDVNNNFIVKGQSEVSKVNIKSMFYTFENFSQNVLLDKHLKGKISGKINFSALWDQKLNFTAENLVVEADVTINNGELTNFEPMYGLSKFIALDELKNIKFSTLHNNIYIKDKQIVIPLMEIQSTAFNIIGSGTHTFDNEYHYKLRILLSEILFKKASKAKKENSEFGIIEDDGLSKTTIPLKVDGKGNVYKIDYDLKSTLQIVKESIAKQKTELKEVFKSEFGWFKNDTTLKNADKVKNRPTAIWDDTPMDDADSIANSSVDNTKKKKGEEKKKNNKTQVEWD